MKEIVQRLNHWIGNLQREFRTKTEIELSVRPSPNKWSKKEIVGHLCDSAVNNMERFIKIQYEDQPFLFQPYNQDQWVQLHNYQDRPVEDVLELFCCLNNQIIHIIQNIPEERLSLLCQLNNKEQRTFEWLIKDYLNHMEHHITKHILAG
ncbi:DinB family protein [Peribacillus kribbensis]|uniref:DinB family protein n=1 Tax=Peribacillus kribbensis TaxID=356658 RepID=UPI000426A34C|nr:DinB family protein [Peribacillus kribbensis]